MVPPPLTPEGIPSEPPPPYSQTPQSTTNTQTTQPTSSTNSQDQSHLQIPHPHRIRNGIPPLSRRSMEDENRELPQGWIRQYDHQNHHQFFVDTNSEPPRSIWHHPYDDAQFISSLSSAERARVQGLHRVPTNADISAETSDEEDYPLPPRPNKNEAPKGLKKYTRKMKDTLTQSTHEERETERRKRAEEEQKAYEQHRAIRQAMSRAIETGERQLIGRDRNGKEVYIEPPQSFGGAGFPGTGGFGGYGGRGYGYNPYNQGPFGSPDARYMRPQNPYNRPYGYGYGGGMGLPLLGGLGGGLLLGDMLGGNLF